MRAPPERPAGVTHDGTRWSNAEQDRVEIEPYDPTWPARFEAEAAAIRAALGGGFAYEVLHVGSTAVPGLAAKPIVDIILEVPDRGRGPSLIVPLGGLGFCAGPRTPTPARCSS
jgi:GrpB-like predicted nucleotidyltransferase (UPF0157 family)